MGENFARFAGKKRPQNAEGHNAKRLCSWKTLTFWHDCEVWTMLCYRAAAAAIQ
jgi:hypothetical protein